MFYKNRRVLAAKVDRDGFSLTELMVVIVIIGMLAGAVAIGTRGYLAAARRGVAEAEVAEISNALDSYAGFEVGYPSVAEGLAVLTESTEKYPGGLLDGDLNDPWGNPYEYVVPGTDKEPFDVASSGPDGRFGTDDDISSSSLKNK